MTDETQQPSDAELLHAAANGDQVAFADFCVRSLPTLSRVVRANCHALGIPQGQAEDFVQQSVVEGIAAVHRRNFEFPRAENITALLITIAKRLMLKWKSKHSRFLREPEEVAAHQQDLKSTQIVEILDAFERLSTADREILELVLLEGLSPSDLSVRLGVSRSTAYKRYERALRRVKKILDC